VGALAVSIVALAASAATAKDFGPGDLRVCDGNRCIPITNRDVLPALGSFYYGGPQPVPAPAVRMGAPAYQLRFRNGYVTGIVATAKLDRFLSYGVYLGRFRRGQWYRTPESIARELRRLARRLEPLRVTPRAVRRSR
jgi:hypothetical protein